MESHLGLAGRGRKVLTVSVDIHYPVQVSRYSCTLVRAGPAVIQGYSLENDLGASKCMRVHMYTPAQTHTHALTHTLTHTHTHTHTHTQCSLPLTLHSLAKSNQGRRKMAWLSNSRTTCLNVGGVITDTTPNFSLWGFLPHLKACVVFLCHTPHSHAHSHGSSSQASCSQANGVLSACTRSPDTFIYSASLGVILIY